MATITVVRIINNTNERVRYENPKTNHKVDVPSLVDQAQQGWELNKLPSSPYYEDIMPLTSDTKGILITVGDKPPFQILQGNWKYWLRNPPEGNGEEPAGVPIGTFNGSQKVAIQVNVFKNRENRIGFTILNADYYMKEEGKDVGASWVMAQFLLKLATVVGNVLTAIHL
ncbi:hypothetical protein FPOAC2_13296 [Fusarium poae]|jgi:hypothetical protein